MIHNRRILLMLAVALVAGALAVGGPAADAATGTWTSHGPADPGLGGGYALTRVSCTATTACTAVGYGWAQFPAAAVPLAERWDGTSWTIQSTPSPVGAVDAVLRGVSCRGAAFCAAVGYTTTGPVGHASWQPLAMRWSGGTWTATPVPLPAGAVGAELNGVACLTSTTCKAVGYYSTDAPADAARPFALSWNGAAWSIDAVSMPAAAAEGIFTDVSCGDFSLCAAVGSWSARTGTRLSALAESWNGTAWHVDGTANPGNQTTLLGVSCYSHTACTASGSHTTLTGDQVGLVERRAGAVWTAQSPPNVAKATVSSVNGIACVSASNCVAVASANGRQIGAQAYGLVWGGLSWKIEHPGAPDGTVLAGISCPMPTYCMSVGENAALGDPITGASYTRTL